MVKWAKIAREVISAAESAARRNVVMVYHSLSVGIRRIAHKLSRLVPPFWLNPVGPAADSSVRGHPCSRIGFRIGVLDRRRLSGYVLLSISRDRRSAPGGEPSDV